MKDFKIHIRNTILFGVQVFIVHHANTLFFFPFSVLIGLIYFYYFIKLDQRRDITNFFYFFQILPVFVAVLILFLISDYTVNALFLSFVSTSINNHNR